LAAGTFFALKGGTRSILDVPDSERLVIQGPDIPAGNGKNVKGGGGVVVDPSSVFDLRRQGQHTLNSTFTDGP